MLDLKKLEEKLDLALAGETEESLATWLIKKRFDAFMSSLGAGEVEDKRTIQSQIQVTWGRNIGTQKPKNISEISTTVVLLAA